MDVSLKPLRFPKAEPPAFPSEAEASSPHGQAIKILLVDDQPANLMALESILDGSEYSLVKALSGAEALRCMLKEDFALVLLDVLMAGMDGFETATLIREHRRSAQTPIIFLTAGNPNDTHVQRGYSLGAVDYIYKPIVPEILKAKVQVFAELFRKTQSLARSEEALRQRLAEHRKAEEARRDSEEKYRALFTRASDAIIVFDSTDDNVLDVNRAATTLYGYAREEFLRLKAADLTAGPRRGASLRSRRLLRTEVRSQKRKDGSLFPAEISYGVFALKGKKMIMALTRDVTERQKAEEAERLKERETMQRQLVATVSHELRTPISAIKASAETLRRGAASDPEARPEFIQIIESHANRLGWLVDDLLALAELESGKVKPRPSNIPLKDFARQLVTDLTPLATQKSVAVEIDVDEELLVRADQAHLGRIFHNLLDNAIKYNKAGGFVRVEGARGDREALVSIRDTGIGIESDDLPLIFEQFHRTDKVRALRIGGTGLGLYIIRNIVQSNGGRIWAESVKDKGSAFHFTLPLADARA